MNIHGHKITFAFSHTKETNQIPTEVTWILLGYEPLDSPQTIKPLENQDKPPRTKFG